MMKKERRGLLNMPKLNRDKFETVLPREQLPALVNVTQDELITRITDLLSRDNTREQLKTRLAYHFGRPDLSSFQQKINEIYLLLQNETLPQSMKYDAALQLEEGILFCTGGLDIKLAYVLRNLKAPRNIAALISTWRSSNLDNVARKMLPIYSEYIHEDYDVHFYHLVFLMANLNQYPIAVEVDDVHSASLLKILKKKEHQWISFGQNLMKEIRQLNQNDEFLPIVFNGLMKSLNHVLNSMGYDGQRTQGYPNAIYVPILEYLNHFFEPLYSEDIATPLTYDGFLCLSEHGVVTNIRLSVVYNYLFLLLTSVKSPYFDDVSLLNKRQFLAWLKNDFSHVSEQNKYNYIKSMIQTFCSSHVNAFFAFLEINPQVSNAIKCELYMTCFHQAEHLRFLLTDIDKNCNQIHVLMKSIQSALGDNEFFMTPLIVSWPDLYQYLSPRLKADAALQSIAIFGQRDERLIDIFKVTRDSAVAASHLKRKGHHISLDVLLALPTDLRYHKQFLMNILSLLSSRYFLITWSKFPAFILKLVETASADLKDDEAFIMCCIEKIKDGTSGFMHNARKNIASPLRFASDRLKQNLDFVNRLLVIDAYIYLDLSEAFKLRNDITRYVLAQKTMLIFEVPEKHEVFNDKDTILVLIEQLLVAKLSNTLVLDFYKKISKRLKADSEVVNALLKFDAAQKRLYAALFDDHPDREDYFLKVLEQDPNFSYKKHYKRLLSQLNGEEEKLIFIEKVLEWRGDLFDSLSLTHQIRIKERKEQRRVSFFSPLKRELEDAEENEGNKRIRI